MQNLYHLWIPFFSWTKNDFLKELETCIDLWKQTYATTPNPEIMLAQSNNDKLRNILRNSNWNLADGFGLIIWSLWKINNRICWSDVFYDICELSVKKWYKIFLLWWDKWVPEKVKDVLEKKFLNIKIVWVSMWFEKTNSQETFDLINNTKPNIIFLALWCPRQEFWIEDNMHKFPFLNFAIWIWWTFDFVIGKQKRAPKILRKIWLEWMWRLILEPNRIGRIYNAIFWYLGLVLKNYFWKS